MTKGLHFHRVVPLVPAAGFPACTHAPRFGCPQVSAGGTAASLAGATGSSITPGRVWFAGLKLQCVLLVTVCANTYTLHLQEICRFIFDGMSNVTNLSVRQVEACYPQSSAFDLLYTKCSSSAATHSEGAGYSNAHGAS